MGRGGGDVAQEGRVAEGKCRGGREEARMLRGRSRVRAVHGAGGA
jgi:hypothetical protein